MNILVTGANGQLGNEMRIVASLPSVRQAGMKFTFTDVCQASEEARTMLARMAGTGVDTSTSILDITNEEAVCRFVAGHSIDACVNCAAYTNVDKAEDDRELCELLNSTAPLNLAKAMRSVGGWLVHISTDYVFGGDPYNTPCREEQKGTPTGVYGETKLHGEQNIMAAMSSQLKAHSSRQGGYVILRTAWLYSEFGRNFVKTMLDLTSTRAQLKVVFDQCGTPTYALDLAKAIVRILEAVGSNGHGMQPSAYSGIYHYSNEGVTSWYDFTRTIQSISLEQGGASKADSHVCDIQPCHSNEFPSKVIRPAYSVLDKTKVKQTFHLDIPYWVDSLRECLHNIRH
ncbi:MAG: dTDP-4-dehydrorhamnose reductase [Bacteroidaceae bacterium]